MERGVLIGADMKTSLRRSLSLMAGFLATTAFMQAHPGHDGHDVTWDFSAGHLASHPVATVVCAVLLVAAAWAVARAVGAGSERVGAMVHRRTSGRRD